MYGFSFLVGFSYLQLGGGILACSNVKGGERMGPGGGGRLGLVCFLNQLD